MTKEHTLSNGLQLHEQETRAFSLIAPSEASSVLFSSPHSGRYYPEDFRKLLRVPLMDLRRVEDAYVDELIAGVTELGAGLLTANYPRSFVDLNRSENELDSRMFRDGPPTPAGERSPRVEAGLGCIPRIAASGEDIHARKLSRKEADQRLALAYAPFHAVLDDQLNAIYARHGQAVLVDCHSMPSIIGGRRVQADIVLGTRHGSSCDESLARLVEGTFVRRGYRVLRNVPYAGGYLTEKHGRPLEDRQAIQIEINRRIYMDESEVAVHAGARKFSRDFLCAAQIILDWADQKKAAP
ncbi:N-formylglutamate amidohydrolase [Ponticaulis profundi]|uniref:N-formylglutamate amidohydrolase n=1 Tax=Ponticaulis profundi TaxID=2665222 RepID=A0ABW1S809_9PROT